MPTIEDLLEEGSKEIVRGHLRKIVEIYDLEWIVVHELIQNAIDAVQANSKVVKGEIDVCLDFDSDTVTVCDNGIGFKHDLGLLRPGGTGSEKRLSSRSPAKGYQGVGLKAVMYSTEYFELESRTLEEEWIFISEGLHGYIDPKQHKNPEYIEEQRPLTTPSTDSTYTTKISARFTGGTLANFISAISRFLNEDSEKWKSLYRKQEGERGRKPYEEFLAHFVGWYFRTQSYVGCVNSLLNVPVKNPDTDKLEYMKPMNVKITMRSATKFADLPGQVGEWLGALEREEFSTTLPYKAWDFAEVALENNRQEAKYRIAPEVIQIKPNDSRWDELKVSFRDKFLDLKLVPNERGEDLREKYADIIAILERPRSRVRAEDFSDVLEKITGIYLAIGRTSAFETLGIPNRGLKMIASNGTPTAHELTVRSTSSTWYLETIHFVVNVDATLNIGKRHLVNTRLVGRLKEFFEACYPTLVSISKLFVERDISGGGEEVPMPEVLDLPQIRRKNISFRRFPADENTLIGLFSATMSHLDPDFSVYSFFGNARYDGKFLWNKQEPKSDVELRLLEFKVQLQKLVDEFDMATHDKEFKDVSLIIVWERKIGKSGWNVKGISDDKRNRLENKGVPTDLIEYVLEDAHGRFCPLICVADLLTKIPVDEGASDDLDDFVRAMG